VSPLCTRLSCLDVGPIVAAIKSIARGEAPDVAEMLESVRELSDLALMVQLPVARIVGRSMSQTEALALLQDEAIGASDSCPPTLGRVDR
jgi:hypothetical protein